MEGVQNTPDPDNSQFGSVAGEEGDPPRVVEGYTVPAVSEVIHTGPAGPQTIWRGWEDEALGSVGGDGVCNCPHASVSISVAPCIAVRLVATLNLDVSPLLNPPAWMVKWQGGVGGKERER